MKFKPKSKLDTSQVWDRRDNIQQTFPRSFDRSKYRDKSGNPYQRAAKRKLEKAQQHID